ncbi:MAG: hypothetical protein BM557_05235 [Flavobacterium sp. MedPE-SWcel]|mgnify:CR=1 FL=1|uniref:T9SS type B sorting domain-containing protein n=1 Tax=uncultured Flavobacterium sp. TaxID=165435 RepID=UPI0009143DC0|nr:T9SS type B sorting domain-containing protein [uncultured Flavobacterium sp.]OIQ21156.1 MAG: hypothetical protein BM557_05235 [Flavobacterium sp. MedPE-SWcel]
MVNVNLSILVFVFYIPFFSFAQLQDFDLDVIATNESCDDNGSLTFNVTNDTAGASFIYTVFLQPNLVDPVAVTSDTSVDNLDSGTYTIIAVQSFEGESNSQEVSVVVEDVIEPLSYVISSVNQNCSIGGEIAITTTNGEAAQYEIISGPETRPLQTSNVFEGLAEGTYNIRVFDICGQGVVTTYTLVLQTADPVVTVPEYEEVFTGDCDSVTITNTIVYPEGVAISYPLTITYTIHPPEGAPDIIETVTYNEGAPNSFELIHEFALYDDVEYTYDIQITNGCDIEYGNSGMVINPVPQISQTLEELECGTFFLALNISQYSPPFTLNFSTTPEGFNPEEFNTSHPGPFSISSIQYGGEGSPIPEGNYSVDLVDACGREASVDFEVIYIIPDPVVAGRNNGCFSNLGRIVASVGDRDIVTAQIIDAPSAYIDTLTEPLPQDVSSSINSSGRLLIPDLPLGNYVIRITDICGDVYELPVEVPPFVEQDFVINTLADCTIGIGAIEILSGNGALTSVTLVGAPNTYSGTVPSDLSGSIVSGSFFMDNLPEGDYTFQGVDVCGIEQELTINVVGYEPSETPFTFVPNCGSFDIIMSDTAVSSGTPTYWLQRLLNTDTNEWGHPDTNTVYTEGSVPTEDNSLQLENNTTILNLTFSGDFRIIKSFDSYGNGNETKNCLEELGTFNYLSDPRINSVYRLACSGSPNNVFIDADGIPTLTYSIDMMDGEPFNLDNGNSNVFEDLASGSYRFVVEDGCGNINRVTQNIDVLPDLVEAIQPDNLFYCIDSDSENELSHEFNLSELNDIILGDQSEDFYTLTYHLTPDDADTGENPLPELYTANQATTIIYARLIHNFITICHDVVSFELQLNSNPVLQLEEFRYICEDSFITLFAGNVYDSYLWSTEETTSSIIVTEPGVYSVTVTDDSCQVNGEVTVELSAPATIIGIDTEDWTYNNNTITVLVTGIGNYEYSINGVSYQSENTFTDLKAGLYTVYIRDTNGCGVVEQEVVLLNYPKFFTPNGDGVNETWRIPFSSFEPDLFVIIFDRYGKIITGFDSQSQGWDGTYDGNVLPSTDYWFSVTRQDGTVHKGHFSMIR